MDVPPVARGCRRRRAARRERRQLDARRAGRAGCAPARVGAGAGRAGPRGAAGVVRARGRGRGHPVGQDGWLPRGLSLLQSVGPLRVAGEGRRRSSISTSSPRRPRRRRGSGASEFCIVLAIRGPDARVMRQLLDAVPIVRERTGLNVAVSAGILTRDQAVAFADGGVHRYNHNLETARSFFGTICTTHTWEERFETCRLVREVGMELCCGVLLGMGESDAQRLELLAQLRDVEPAEVPLNFLNPRPGTPLGDARAGRAARGDSVDRPLSPRAARRHPALRGRTRGDAARSPGHGHDVGHQRARSSATTSPPSGVRPTTTCGCSTTCACRSASCRRCCDLMFCSGCGRPSRRVRRPLPAPARPAPVLCRVWTAPHRAGHAGVLHGPLPRPRRGRRWTRLRPAADCTAAPRRTPGHGRGRRSAPRGAVLLRGRGRHALHSAVDHKPKTTTQLRRLDDIAAHPDVTVLVDHYDDDWARLWWVMVRGRGRVVARRRRAGRALLAAKYAQYRDRPPGGPFIQVALEEWRMVGVRCLTRNCTECSNSSAGTAACAPGWT